MSVWSAWSCSHLAFCIVLKRTHLPRRTDWCFYPTQCTTIFMLYRMRSKYFTFDRISPLESAECQYRKKERTLTTTLDHHYQELSQQLMSRSPHGYSLFHFQRTDYSIRTIVIVRFFNIDPTSCNILLICFFQRYCCTYSLCEAENGSIKCIWTIDKIDVQEDSQNGC